MMEFLMTEELFAALQSDLCWFCFAMPASLAPIDPTVDVESELDSRGDAFIKRQVFAMIFGSHGYRRDLERAKRICTQKISEVEQEKKRWIERSKTLVALLENSWAQYNILLGTALAYEHDYLKSAYFLMRGLRTKALDLSNAYCDFIRLVLSEAEKLPAAPVTYEGVGFSIDTPMGGTATGEGRMRPEVAQRVICALAPKDGGVILAHLGRSGIYGKLRRFSAHSTSHAYPIDVYEVLMIDKDGELKTLRLCFNAYFPSDASFTVRLPKGFCVENAGDDLRLSMYKYVE